MTTITATATTRQPRAKKAVARTLRILARPTAEKPGAMVIVVGGDEDGYNWTVSPSDAGGAAYRIDHLSGDEARRYIVTIEPTGNACNCLGHRRHGHCKHVDALAKLTASDAAKASAPVCSPAPKAAAVCGPVMQPVELEKGDRHCRTCKGTRYLRFSTDAMVGVSRCDLCDGSGIDDF